MMSTYKPFLIAWNLTGKCNLRCSHCYMDAAGDFSTGSLEYTNVIPAKENAASELSLEEGFSLIDDIASVNSGAILVLTGGEPLLYEHTLNFAKYASQKGLMVVIGSNGLLLDDAMVQKLKACGVSGVGISLDSLDPARHDSFRGFPGAWKKAVEAMERCRDHGLQFQLHNSVTSFNWTEVPRMVEFARQKGARVVNFFFMVCTGRGEKITDITPEQYEEVLSSLLDLQERYPGMLIRARCAPHFKRIAYQKDPHSPITKAEGYLGGGCLAGSHYCRIAPDGDITPCPYMPLTVGNVRKEGFSDIWENAQVFQDLRSPQLKGKCGECEYEILCGGCRARPYASHQDYLDEDLWCQYVPKGGETIGAANMDSEEKMTWTAEAEERLKRLPFFLQGMIRGRVEKHALEQGISVIKPELLDELRKKRFGDSMPEMPVDVKKEEKSEVRSQKSEETAGDSAALPWTREAIKRLDAIPDFMKSMFREALQEIALKDGHLEVNIEVWEKFEKISGEKSEARSQNSGIRHPEIEWTEEAIREVEGRYKSRPQFARDFIVDNIKEDIEKAAADMGYQVIDPSVLKEVENRKQAAVEWSEEAWKRLQKAPDFIRSGIKKAAERRAGRMGISTITSELLTEFRNMAMMKAVKRIKKLGYTELTFDAFDYAKENIKKIRDSKEAQDRLDEIREYVSAKGKVGLIDADMLEKMKEYLKRE